MVLPLLTVPIVLIGTTVGSLVAPFFLPKTEAEQATIDLNKKLEKNPQMFNAISQPQPIKTQSFKTNLQNQLSEVKLKVQQKDPMTIGIILAIGLVLLLVLMR